MGIRRKNISDFQKERVKDLLDVKTPREVFVYLQNSKERLSLSSIYKINKEKRIKGKTPLPSQENMQQILGRSRHAKTILHLLDRYVGQLHVSYEPEDFITPSEGVPPKEEESAFWFFAKKVVPSLETQIDSQIDSETLTLAPELERDPGFEALTGHYEGTELWKKIVTYKQEGGKYVSTGAKLHRTIMKLIDSVFADKAQAHTFRSALAELIREDLASVRVKLHLEGIETDKTAVLKRMPDEDYTSLLQGTELLQRYLSDESRVKVQENGKLFADLQNLLARITEVYQRLKTKQRDILRAVKEEKFKGQLPAGSKCKFCPAT